MQKSTISRVHADQSSPRGPVESTRTCTVVSAAALETLEPSRVYHSLLPMDNFNHAQIKRKEYAPMQVGHDTLQTPPTSEGSAAARRGSVSATCSPNDRFQACANQTAGVCLDTSRSRHLPDVVHKRRGVGSCRGPTATRRGPPRGRGQFSAQTEGVGTLSTPAPTPAVLSPFLSTGRASLFLDRTHERRQFFQVVGRMEADGMVHRHQILCHSCWLQTSRPLNTVHRLQDQFQQMLPLTQRRSHKTVIERVPSCSKGDAAYAGMERVITARELQEQADLAYAQKFAEASEAEEAYHNAIRRTLDKTAAIEKHVKTVTMRADSLVTTEADFFQTLIEQQEASVRELNTPCGQLCQPRPTQG